MATKREWKGTTFGNEFMLRSLIAMLRHVDVRLFYAFTAVFIIPVTMVVGKSAKIAYRYFRRHQHYGRLKSIWHAYRNHCLFSQVVLDKFAMFAGKKFKLNTEGFDHFLSLADKAEGFVMLSSHIGNYEMAGYTLVSEKKRFNALVFGGEKSTVMAGRQSMFNTQNIRMITVNADMSHLFAMNEALANGEIMSIPADRLFGSTKAVEVELLGSKASLPMGPFAVAVSREVPVLAVNVMKSSTRGYTAYITPLSYDHHLRPKEQIRQLATAYAAELEKQLRRYPDQWYNYFDFWKEED